MRFFCARYRAALCAAFFALSGWANALPLASNVPGGIALIRLGSQRTESAAPRAWFDERPVFVAAEQGEWVAVLGLALDLPTGRHALRVRSGETEKELHFEVHAKRYAEQRITLKNNSKVTLAPDDEARALSEIATIQALKRHWRDTVSPDETDTSFLLPADGRLSSRFGLRRFFNGEARAPHSGLDLAVGRGTPIKASAAGRVLATDDYFFNGKTVFIDHGNGLITMYCHLERIDVTPGASLTRGQPIGLSGMSGRASGPHLHWSVMLNGVMVDPELFLPARH